MRVGTIRDAAERCTDCDTGSDASWNSNDLTQTSGEWLRGTGPESDIVISSRIRLARNLAEFPFISRASQQDRARHRAHPPRQRDRSSKISADLQYINVNELEGVDRQFLVERQLISREHAESQGARGVAIDSREQVSLMINEEDHLRIQVMHSGLDLHGAWEQINRIDDLIERTVTYAFHPRLGYLTACPTNVGTGVRVSVMLHLPALVITRQIEKVFRSLQKISLAVRGLYGEGSQAMGDFYQICNQITLGPQRSRNWCKQVGDIVPVLIDYERQAREFLVRESHETCTTASAGPTASCGPRRRSAPKKRCTCLSSVRMGVNLGLIPRSANSRLQRAVHPHPAGPSAKAARRRARHRRPQHRAGPLSAAASQQGRRGAEELSTLFCVDAQIGDGILEM